MGISIFDLFSIGIGPSSSHTLGPMRAANAFNALLRADNQLDAVTIVTVELYGSLALTGKGHGTDKAIILGLLGYEADSIDPSIIADALDKINKNHSIQLAGEHTIAFEPDRHLIYYSHQTLPQHTNGLRFTAWSHEDCLRSETYFSVGGGFIVHETDFNCPGEHRPHPYPFDTAAELFDHCQNQNSSIADIMMANEYAWRPENEVREGVLRIKNMMLESIQTGLHTEGTLPGGLNVERRAPTLYARLLKNDPGKNKAVHVFTWLNAYAMAVNEENAAGNRIVTAPTNGAAGIVPAVMQYLCDTCPDISDDILLQYLLTAAAIASLYKKKASISGAEMGCQGEVGVACSMAAGALAAVSGGNLRQVENAAEIGMEHHLGLTCDPIAGLVQIPCIERNGIAAVQAVNAANLALAEERCCKIRLDNIIATMRATGEAMSTSFKETSLDGLAKYSGLSPDPLSVNVPEC